MRYSFLRPAQRELEEAVEYYNKQQERLGEGFAEEVRRTIDRILEAPNRWAKSSKNTRRCRTERFPYGVIYQAVSEDEILIVAVMHLHRKPDYWIERV